jgi:glucosyl-dolichyl phosphate glucuronosyltransferase
LNTGIQAAEGDVLAFMDDDVVVEPWLQNLTACLESREWAGAGGRILPDWASAPPRWLSLQKRVALSPLAIFDLGSQAGPLLEPPYGTNMAFRKEMFQKYGGFRTDLGPNPSSLMRGEDTEFGIRLLEGGERLRYEPSAVVFHPVQEERLRKRYFLAWWFDKGRSDIRQFGIRERGWRVRGVPLVSFRRVIAWALRWMSATSPSYRFDCRLQVARFLGEIRECCCLHSRRKMSHSHTRIRTSQIEP